MALGVSGFLVMLPSVSDACQPVARPSASPSAVARAIEPGSDVLIIGDSYTAGRGSSDGEHGWAQDLVADRGWDAKIDGIPGTGYVNTGRPRTSRYAYEARVAKQHALHPDLVIVQGSQNDWDAAPSTLRSAVTTTLTLAKEQWPDAVVVAVGPSAPEPRAESTASISDMVSAGARAAGVPYLDALGDRWFTSANSPGYAAEDGEHLDDAGYAYLADRIGAALDTMAAAPAGQQCA